MVEYFVKYYSHKTDSICEEVEYSYFIHEIWERAILIQTSF